MFLVSSHKPIDPQLRDLVEQVEKQTAGISVLAARQFRYSLYQTLVEVTISEPRKFNVLEEFILRAGIELSPPPTENELASVLGLDRVFVRNTTSTLQALQTLSVTPDSQITLTPQGRQFYKQGSVPQPPQTKQVYAIADYLQGLTFLSSPLDEAQVNLPDLEDSINIENRLPDVSSLTLQEIQQQLQKSGLGLHIPEEGKVVTSSQVSALTQTIWRTVSIFVIFDSLEDEVRLQVRSGKKILEDASNWLNALQAERRFSLQALCPLSDETLAYKRELILQKNEEVELRIEKIQQKVVETAREARAKGDNNLPSVNAETGSAILLRDNQIRKEFLDTLNSARHDVLIYSPWVSEEVIDDEFIRLLQKLANLGVWILIGYGLGRRQEDEDQLLPAKVEQLREVRTPEGLPAVQVFWLGNSHAEEIVVDQKVHLCGSHNWLSYRGDWLPRGESVYKVITSAEVQKAYEFLAEQFQAHAQKLWDAAVLERNPTLVILPLCVWGALGLEEMALKQLQIHNFLELLPVWLQVVCQGLRSGLTPRLRNALKVALDLLSQISEAAPNIEPLRQSWRQVMSAIAALDSDAVTLLSDEAWTQFTRLGIASEGIDSAEKFIAEYTLAPKKLEKDVKKERQNASNKQTKTKRSNKT